MYFLSHSIILFSIINLHTINHYFYCVLAAVDALCYYVRLYFTLSSLALWRGSLM
jgi:hypothetical protein